MDDDRFFAEFFATEFGGDESEKKTHKEDYNWFGRVRSSRGYSGSWGESERGAVGEIFSHAEKSRTNEWAVEFFVFGRNTDKTSAPFGSSVDDTEITKALTEKNEGHFGKEVEIISF